MREESNESTFEARKHAGEALGTLPKVENAPSEDSGVLLNAEIAQRKRQKHF